MKVLICSKLDEFNLNISFSTFNKISSQKSQKFENKKLNSKLKADVPHTLNGPTEASKQPWLGVKICIQMRPREPVKPGKNSVRPFFNISWHFSTGWHFGQITWHTLSEDIGADHGLQTHVCQSWIQVSALTSLKTQRNVILSYWSATIHTGFYQGPVQKGDNMGLVYVRHGSRWTGTGTAVQQARGPPSPTQWSRAGAAGPQHHTAPGPA